MKIVKLTINVYCLCVHCETVKGIKAVNCWLAFSFHDRTIIPGCCSCLAFSSQALATNSVYWLPSDVRAHTMSIGSIPCPLKKPFLSNKAHERWVMAQVTYIWQVSVSGLPFKRKYPGLHSWQKLPCVLLSQEIQTVSIASRGPYWIHRDNCRQHTSFSITPASL